MYSKQLIRFFDIFAYRTCPIILKFRRRNFVQATLIAYRVKASSNSSNSSNQSAWGHVVLADPEGNEFCVIEPGNNFLAGSGRIGAINCDGTKETGYFSSEALGWPLVWNQDEETAIRAPDGTGPLITWSGPPLLPKTTKNRLHLDIAPTERGGQQAEVDRLGRRPRGHRTLRAGRARLVYGSRQRVRRLSRCRARRPRHQPKALQGFRALKPPVLLDTGPLVALLNRRERLHARVKAVLPQLPVPLLTVEPVLTEALYLLRAVPKASRAVLTMLRNGVLRVPLAIEPQAHELDTLMTRFSNVPMSLADACLVRLVELMPDASIFTFDSDFTIYRTQKNRVIQLIEY